MTTFTVDVQAKRRGDLVDLTINQHQVTLFFSEVDTPEKFAAWYLAQSLAAPANESTLRQRFVIEAHQTEIDGAMVWVVDSATPAQLGQDAGEAGIVALPGWATFTAAEAEAWITNNVTNLATAITALKAMAKMLVHLRDRGRSL